MGEWVDTGVGLCACGQERRLYRPVSGTQAPICVECTERLRKRAELEAVAERSTPADNKKASYWKDRRQHLAAAGKCVDCAIRPPLAKYKRCSRCHDRLRRYRPPKMDGAA